jgi:hypothetical protein
VSHVELACERVESVASNARRDAQSSVGCVTKLLRHLVFLH